MQLGFYNKSKSFYLINQVFFGEKKAPNELRIDAAGGKCANRKGQSAAASVRVELSRIWKMKPGTSGEKIS
jgi:hypothetical protein